MIVGINKTGDGSGTGELYLKRLRLFRVVYRPDSLDPFTINCNIYRLAFIYQEQIIQLHDISLNEVHKLLGRR